VEVVLLEKNPRLGGTTAWSIGSISATRTPHQERAGIVDTPDAHCRDMLLFPGNDRPDNDALRKVLTDNVPDTVRFLCDAGVEFFGPLEEAPHTKPRMHNILPNSRAYIYHLEKLARRLGVHIVVEARARRLLIVEGKVTGVEFERAGGGAEQVHAARGVVLAAGDYAASPEMRCELIGEALAAIEPINPTSTGDGLRMGRDVGGKIINGDMHHAGIRFLAPARPSWISRLPPSRWLMRPAAIGLHYMPSALLRKFLMGFLTTVLVPSHKLFDAGAILINREGRRFADERQKMVHELDQQPGGTGYILLDGALGGRFTKYPYYVSTAPGFAYAFLKDYESNRPDLFHRADSLEKLARQLNMDPAQLVATVKNYNNNSQDSASRVPPRADRPPLSEPPFYVLGPVRNYINFTDGGLAVSQRLEVLDGGGKPIPGLYAAGSNGQGGLLLKGHGHHLGWAFTSGRLAGAYAAGSDRP